MHIASGFLAGLTLVGWADALAYAYAANAANNDDKNYILLAISYLRRAINRGVKPGSWFTIVRYVVSAGLVSLPFAVYGVSSFSWAIAFATGVGLILANIDLHARVLPETLTWILLFSGLLWSPIALETTFAIWSALLSGLIVMTVMVLAGLIKRIDVWSGGDVAFVIAAGAWVGAQNLALFWVISTSTFVLHCLFDRSEGLEKPMGPALCAGLLGTIHLHSFFSFV
ncbi:prepilin peptidase [Pseudovibrio ascidiaceicola]|uniref:prepilin peptidase n=1 Tax=Pseudovibrio ascidiaceicola TaxID=285279 RepID=UPI003D36D60E